MRIKTSEEQVRERIQSIERLIIFQTSKVDRAYRRLKQREDWALSFLWIWNGVSTLDFTYRIEDEILSSLKDYKDILIYKLTYGKY